MAHIAVLLMIKNEGQTLSRTLESVRSMADSLIVYDTGSVDDSIEVLREFACRNKIPLRLRQGEFVDFATSRNVLLDFADEHIDVDYYLLMDANDELRGGDLLRALVTHELTTSTIGWHIRQEWTQDNMSTNYYNIRLIRPRSHWRFVGVVHEYLTNLKNSTVNCPRLPMDIMLFQDRKWDAVKSKHRYPRDAELLRVECVKNPTDARSHFYLAQTYASMGKWDEAYRYYLKRTEMKGFDDEVFHCWLRMGMIAVEQQNAKHVRKEEGGDLCVYTWETALGHFMRALECSMRVEPLMYLAEHYMSKKKWELAFHFAKIACGLELPQSALFVDRYMYHYTRFHMLGIVAYYCGRYKEGMVACKIAIERENQDIDRQNLTFYEEKLNKKG